MINVIKYRWVFLGISAILIALSIFALTNFGLKEGIDFTGGSLWQLKVNATPTEISNFFENDLKLPLSSISHDESTGVYSLAFRDITDAERNSAMDLIKKEFGEDVEEVDFWTVSPSVSAETKNKAFTAIGLVVLGISLFIAYAFRKVSRPVSSWKYGAITLLTLVHNVVIPAGAYALMSHYMGISIDTNFVVALLVVMGFSVHDTIVVFDRIRENITKARSVNLNEIINKSVSETIRRSINTSLTLIIVLLTLYFLGPLSLKYFVLTIVIGTTVGAYSSIFVASPLLGLAQGKKSSNR